MGEVSCRNIRWLLDLCAEKGISPQLFLKNIPYSIEHLKNPGKFIDWCSYCNLITHIRKFLSLEDIIETSRRSWKHPNLRAYPLFGRILYSIREQYIYIFGNDGTVSRQFPCDMSVIPLATGHLSISLNMQNGLQPCDTFHHALAGQIVGLPESLGYKAAQVRLVTTSTGAGFEVDYDERGGFLAPARRFVSWPFTSYKTARELSSTYDALIQKHAEIEFETAQTKTAETKVRQSREFNDLLAKNMRNVIWIMNDRFDIKYITPSVLSLTGYTPEEIMERGIQILFTKTSVKNITCKLNAAIKTRLEKNNTDVMETEILHREGHRVAVEVTINFLADPGQEISQVIGTIHDASDQKRLELDFQEREESFRIITTTAQDGILTIDESGIITFANPSCAKIFGYKLSELIGGNLTTLMPDEYRSVHQNGMESYLQTDTRQTDWNARILTGLTKDKEHIPIDISFAEYRLKGRRFFTAIIRDIKHRKQMEEEKKKLQQQLQASQKVESIGQLAGGVAHDFNNLLVAILGYVDLAMDKDLDQPSLKEYLTNIRHAGERAADMTQKLLAFSRRQIMEPATIDLNELISGIRSMIRRLIPENIEINFPSGEAGANVLADPGQLEQVIVNLVVNARDAMPKGGTLSISTSSIRISGNSDEADYKDINPATRAGDYICLDITDSGEGMSEEVSNQVFEPFFTTKPEGSGTGLGLAVVFSIVKQHGGFIEVRSQENIGTSIRVYLPKSDSQVQVPKKPISLPAESASGTILVVEDDDQVRNLTKLLLTGIGYSVTACDNGEEAMEIFATSSKKIDLVLMDVVMPRIGGKAVMEKMKILNPDMRFLFTSGYSANGIHTNFIQENGLEFIAKPYTTQTLLAKVGQVLDDGRHNCRKL